MLAWLAIGLILILPSSYAQSGTKFEKCRTLGSDLCFKLKIKEIVVKIGAVGTDDDVTLQICSDYDTSQCCKTPVLSSLFSDDWSRNDTETWKGKSIGNCSTIPFKVQNQLLLTITKSGKSKLLVDHITIVAQSPDKKITELEQFKCFNFEIGGTKLPTQTKFCNTDPYHYQQIVKAIFQMGPDGTDDDVIFKIASDSNTVTCSHKLSHTFSDDWRRNKLETWLKKDFGQCKDKLYKITNAPVFSLSKKGKDNLVVRSSEIHMKRMDTGAETKYNCGGFELKGDCKDASFCTKTFTNCQKSVVSAGKASAATTQRPSTTTRSSPRLNTTANLKTQLACVNRCRQIAGNNVRTCTDRCNADQNSF